MDKPVLVVIVGPTAVGKTSVGIELAKIINSEIISGDSMQVYRGMDIGTAKPTEGEMQGIPHRMIDILNPDEDFSVAVFQKMVESHIVEINNKNKIPILVGGTGLYVRSIIDHYDFSPIAVDADLRKSLREEANEYGNEYIFNKLKEADPFAAEKIHPNDTKRIIRALEVYYSTGKPISSYYKLDKPLPPKYNLVYNALTMDREKLYLRIEKRVDEMFEKGLVEEIKKLLNAGYNKEMTSLQGIGYKEVIGYLEGEYSLSRAIELVKRNTRRFAKRQLTWFRRDSRISWIDVEKYGSTTEIAKEIAFKLEGQFIKM